MMAGELRAGADDLAVTAPPHFHRIIRHETMAADDEIQRALALAHAALTDDQHSEAEDVE